MIDEVTLTQIKRVMESHVEWEHDPSLSTLNINRFYGLLNRGADLSFLLPTISKVHLCLILKLLVSSNLSLQSFGFSFILSKSFLCKDSILLVINVLLKNLHGDAEKRAKSFQCLASIW